MAICRLWCSKRIRTGTLRKPSTSSTPGSVITSYSIHYTKLYEDAAAFAKGLADGGYATDPAYADKLQSVIAKVA